MSPGIAEQVAYRVATVFDSLSVPYLIGGSLASSVHGVYRATADIDIAAALRTEHVGRFCAELQDQFYVDANAVRSAVDRRSSFNVIYLAEMFKADIFVTDTDPWRVSEFERGVSIEIEAGAEALMFSSAEDVLLHKLRWYQRGGSVSERQWNDVLAIIRIQGDGLDREYLRSWAPRIGIDQLLSTALQSVDGEGTSSA